VALVLMLPGLGLPLALVVRRLRGVGRGSDVPAPTFPPRDPTPEEVLDLADQPCALDQLVSRVPEERLDALVSLAGAGDANAVTLLRWTVQHGQREAMLEAALTLEELDVQRGRQLEDASLAFEQRPSFTTAVAAGDAALAGIVNGLADRATLPALAERARAWFQYALTIEPNRAAELAPRLAVVDGEADRTAPPPPAPLEHRSYDSKP
jgi:hypothetical protein